jgi:hypothetical protein
MHKIFRALILVFLLILTFSQNVNAEDSTHINDLIEKAKDQDGKEVIVQGEAIGERLDRGDYSWVNINDGTNAIGVWIRKNEAGKILHYGNYKNKGDIVIIKGIFNRACKEHGGETDLHNTSIKIAEEGHPVKEKILTQKIAASFILAAFAFVFLAYLFKRLKLND